MAIAEKLSIGAAARYVGRCEATLRNWHRRGTMVPEYLQENGYRLYTRRQLDEFLGDMRERALVRPEGPIARRV